MRFAEIPITDLSAIASIEARPTPIVPPAAERPADTESGTETRASESKVGSKQREAAARLIESIGRDFSRLRKSGRSGAWADLEEKIMQNAHLLIDTGMISAKEWISMSIDIEQFRKAEGGSSEVPGDALAKWLSESDEVVAPVKAKKTKGKSE